MFPGIIVIGMVLQVNNWYYVCLFQDAVHTYSGGLDQTLKMYDLNASMETILGEHKGAIRCVEFASEVNAVLTGSWDGTVKMWDSRVPNCVGTYNQGNERVSYKIISSFE